ncbi:MAG: hypothetical protein KAT35_06075 [Candidatus Aenigmarchaeota archaeon]|nr:hypothetical protein [Candidatus Aenigmarchaeota archaeon]
MLYPEPSSGEMRMKYYGLLSLVLVCLMASVFVQGKNLFGSDFFTVAYAAMALVLIIGSKSEETMKIDITLGLLLIFVVAFISTQTLIEMLTNNLTGDLFFKVGIIVSLDYAALGFLRLGKQLRSVVFMRGDGRYEISKP